MRKISDLLIMQFYFLLFNYIFKQMFFFFSYISYILISVLKYMEDFKYTIIAMLYISFHHLILF